MSSKAKFNKDWLRPDLFPQFSSWVEEIKSSPHQYRCNAFCRVYIWDAQYGATGFDKPYDKVKKTWANYGS